MYFSCPRDAVFNARIFVSVVVGNKQLICYNITKWFYVTDSRRARAIAVWYDLFVDEYDSKSVWIEQLVCKPAGIEYKEL